jgi:hypothetical protein
VNVKFNLAQRLKEAGTVKNSLVEIIMSLEENDTSQMVRMLILLDCFSGKKKTGTIEGITKLAIYDFLLKYPIALYKMMQYEKELGLNNLPKFDIKLQSYDINSIEAKMMMFNFAPWDYKYRRGVSILTSKQLILLEMDKNKVKISITNKGADVVDKMYSHKTYVDIREKSIIIKRLFGTCSQKKLVNRIYTVFPEILQLKARMDVTV